jgi:heat shock protein HslJ
MRPSILRLVVVLSVVATLAAACGERSSTSALVGKNWGWTTSSGMFVGGLPDPTKYTITFAADGTFASKVDCNQVAGTYTVRSSGGITIVPGPTTLVACPPGSLEGPFLAGLSSATNFQVGGSKLILAGPDGVMGFEGS